MKNTKISLILLFSVLVQAVSVSAQASDVMARIRSAQTVTLGYRESAFPFSYSLAGKPVGYAVDLCLLLVDAIRQQPGMAKINVAYVPVTPENRIAAIVDGRADLECGSTTNNAERRLKVAFTIPHFYSSVKMLVRADSGIKNWSDLSGRKVVTTKGTNTIHLLVDRDKARALTMTMIESASHDNSFKMLENKEVDAFVMGDAMLYGMRAGKPVPASFAVVGDSLLTEPYAIMLDKDDPAFAALMDKSMAAIILGGQLNKIYTKWFNSPIPPDGVNLQVPMGFVLRDSLAFPTSKVGN